MEYLPPHPLSVRASDLGFRFIDTGRVRGESVRGGGGRSGEMKWEEG